MNHWFVADIGGTNARLATVVDGKLSHIKKYLCEDYTNIDEAIQQYFKDTGLVYDAGCLAVACPVMGDRVSLTNNNWVFSTQQLCSSLGLSHLDVINDFTSVAYSLPELSDDQKVKVGVGQVDPKGNIAVLGPGTGLGVDHLTLTDKGWQSLDGEGGHVDFAPVDDDDLIVWQFLRNKFDYVGAEEVLSGRGLYHIYEALVAHSGADKKWVTPAQVSDAAVANSCELASRTLSVFCQALGGFAGNLALNLATTGGVYIGGGIVPRFVEFVQHSQFRSRFENKGRFESYVSPIPTFIITEPDHGLIGAAAYLRQQMQG